MTADNKVTLLLKDAASGDAAAEAALIDAVYDDLRRRAGAMMQREKAGHTLQATALVHETYMRLIRQEHVDWKGRAHFLAMASTLMRRILVDHARKRNAARRGGGMPKLSLDEGLGLTTTNDTDVLELNEALETLGALDARQADIVVMRFFGGLSSRECAAVLGVSTRTVEGDWAVARAWLRRALAGSSSDA